MSGTRYPKRNPKLALVVMCKNEHARIKHTFESVKDYIGEFFIFDTGSTDNTVEIIKQYCLENDIKLNLKQGEFVNFSVSRNELLDFTDSLIQGSDRYLLLLDVNDEMRDMHILCKFVDEFKDGHTGFYLTQRWWTGSSLDSYYNVRMIKSNSRWRYKSVVHEYIITPDIEEKKKQDHEVLYRLEGVYIYQDRTADDDKSFKRFSRDKELLYNEHIKDPHEPRTLFYLAQTCSCLGQIEESYRYYLLRIKELGFYEEVYQSYFRMGELSATLGHDWEESMLWFLKAFQHSQRVEPLIKMAEYYKDNNLEGEKKPEWHTCYMYASMACNMMYPTNNILFVNKRNYTYDRWHLMGIAAFYVGKYKEGKEACLRAIEAENKDVDRNNLKFYLENDIDIIQSGKIDNKCLVCPSFGDKEIRSKDEIDVKHDRNKIVKEVVALIEKERKDQNRPVTAQLLQAVINNSMKRVDDNLDINSNMIATDYDALANNNMRLMADISKLPRKERRSHLRQIIKATGKRNI